MTALETNIEATAFKSILVFLQRAPLQQGAGSDRDVGPETGVLAASVTAGTAFNAPLLAVPAGAMLLAAGTFFTLENRRVKNK